MKNLNFDDLLLCLLGMYLAATLKEIKKELKCIMNYLFTNPNKKLIKRYNEMLDKMKTSQSHDEMLKILHEHYLEAKQENKNETNNRAKRTN